MFIVQLKFSENKAQAGQFMDGHKAWIKRGFDDEVFLLAGSLQSGLGGAVVAHNCTFTELEDIVAEDPFVAQNIVTAEILEIIPSMADERLKFLVG